jgi:hypothetical protein
MAKKFMYICLGILGLAGAFHLGAHSGEAASQCSDVAVATGTIGHGQRIPLPYYADGTQATQDECVWIVIPRILHTGHNNTYGFECRPNPDRTVYFRQVTAHGQYFDSTAQYLIIALRGGATAAESTTWSQIKAEFGE